MSDFTWGTCPGCKVQHAFPTALSEAMKMRRGPDGLRVYCPNGHTWYYVQGETEEEKLRRELNRQRQQNARLEDDARESRRVAEKAQAATKRLKKRVAAGVCPCCHRTVGQMQKHMATKHPEYVADNVVKLARPA